MELNAIEMDPHAARRAFLAYRDEFRKRARSEDEALMKGYRALSQGKHVLHLPTVIGGAGLDDRGLPRLACCRADAENCWVEIPWSASRSAIFYGKWPRWGGRRPKPHVTLPEGTFPAFPDRKVSAARSVVPIVPPQFRPGPALSNYHILWEADWKAVPRDPALLKDLGGGLFSVLAIWDLTDLEALVLGITRRIP